MGNLRITVRLLAMAALFLVCAILFQIWRIAGSHNPWPRRFLGGIARIAGANVRITGPLPRKPVILLANHVSWLDIPVLAGVTGTAFVAHSGLTQSRLLAWLCGMNDTVFVARHDRRSVHRQVEQVRAAMHDMGALAIFPEGTTSDGSELLPFKSSLLSALDPAPEGVIVQPVWIDYGPEVSAMAWVGEEPGLTNFLRILARSKKLMVTVHFAPAFDPTKAGGRKGIAGLAQTRIAAAMAER